MFVCLVVCLFVCLCVCVFVCLQVCLRAPFQVGTKGSQTKTRYSSLFFRPLHTDTFERESKQAMAQSSDAAEWRYNEHMELWKPSIDPAH